MKNILASILLVAAVCATNEVNATRTPKSVAMIRYAGAKCNSTPTSVTILAPPVGTVCKPKLCGIGANTLGFKEDCVSGDGNDYVKTILKEFKKAPVVLNVQYQQDPTCSGKPTIAWGSLATGACVDGKTYSVEKDRSVITKFYADAKCTGAPTSEQTQPPTVTKGQCTNGTKVIALRSASDKF